MVVKFRISSNVRTLIWLGTITALALIATVTARSFTSDNLDEDLAIVVVGLISIVLVECVLGTIALLGYAIDRVARIRRVR